MLRGLLTLFSTYEAVLAYCNLLQTPLPGSCPPLANKHIITWFTNNWHEGCVGLTHHTEGKNCTSAPNDFCSEKQVLTIPSAGGGGFLLPTIEQCQVPASKLRAFYKCPVSCSPHNNPRGQCGCSNFILEELRLSNRPRAKQLVSNGVKLDPGNPTTHSSLQNEKNKKIKNTRLKHTESSWMR